MSNVVTVDSATNVCVVCMCIYIYIYMYMCVCACVCMYVCMYVCCVCCVCMVRVLCVFIVSFSTEKIVDELHKRVQKCNWITEKW